MNGYLLDTNIISEIVKPRPEPKVTSWVDAAEESTLFLSVLTLGEVRKGIASLRDSPKRVELAHWLERSLVLRFSGRILPVDEHIADRWGRIAGAAAARKTPMPVIDGLLAATALQHDLTLVTRDTQGTAGSGVLTFNPWK